MSMFSVLLSVYVKESPQNLQQSLDSLFVQTLLPDEVILVKDGPLSSELDSLIDSYQRQFSILKIVALPTNLGLGKALNEGLKYCSYDFVARMDTDDIAKPDRFEKQIQVFEDRPEVDVVGAWIDEFEKEKTDIISTRYLPENQVEIVKFAHRRCPVNHPVVMFRKETVLRAGGYQHFPLFEDYYLWVRMLMEGAIFYNIQESLLYFRFSSDMFKRRGGWKYACDELHFQYTIWKLGFISLFDCLMNIIPRFIMRILPNYYRAVLYKKILRN